MARSRAFGGYTRASWRFIATERPNARHFMVLPNRWWLIPLSFDAPVTTEYWDDDRAPEFRAMFKRLEAEGMVLAKE